MDVLIEAKLSLMIYFFDAYWSTTFFRNVLSALKDQLQKSGIARKTRERSRERYFRLLLSISYERLVFQFFKGKVCVSQ